MEYSSDLEIREGDIIVTLGSLEDQVMMLIDSKEKMEKWGVEEPGCFVALSTPNGAAMAYYPLTSLKPDENAIFLRRSDILPIFKQLYDQWHNKD